KTFTIPDGLYSGSKTATANDVNLVTGNIKAGTTIFGVAGKTEVVDTTTGDAVAGDILSGKKAWVDGAETTGTITTQTLSNANDTVVAGYYAATTLHAVDADLAAANIKAGTNIFGFTGTAPIPSGTAGAGDVLASKTFSNDSGTGITGTIITKTLNAANDTVAAGYYAATTLSTVDADLAAGNIKTAVNIFGVVGTYGGSGGSASVPKTGQTPTVPLNPAPAGSDGALQKGVAWPNPRFTDNSNGTVTDNLTGLIWLKNANCFGGKDWATALTDCNGLANGTCDLTDDSTAGQWRLPNYFELVSLLDLAYSGPALSNDAGTGQWGTGTYSFAGVQSFYYWSSTTIAYTSEATTSFAWLVGLKDGYMTGDAKDATYPYVWPVRGGQ
ncbi:MAG: DUF1566 domain-containing protein, partial [Deltaproteobacteria bacterium]